MSDEPETNAAPTAPLNDEPKVEESHEVVSESAPQSEVTAEQHATEATEATHEAAAFEHAESVVEETVAEQPEPETLAPLEEAPTESEEESVELPVGEQEAAESIETAESPTKTKRSRKKAATAETLAAPAEVEPSEDSEPPAENKKKWYAIKVQSGREESIKAAILRKVAIEGLEEYLGRIEIPVEEVVEKKSVRVKDKKTGEYTTQEKKVTKKKKKFHGYIFAELEFNDRILYLFRETSGVGDFLNMRGKPPVPEPMPDHEVQSMLTGVNVKDPTKKQAKVKIEFEKGDRVRIREGPFANSEGEVKAITEPKDPTESPKITVVVTLWGRPVDVELEYWQVEKV